MGTYKMGDCITQSCTDCGITFDYRYPGMGRPTRHRCPACKAKIRSRPRIGSVQTAVCKDCGAIYEFLTTRGRGPERCPDCRPTPILSLLEAQCDICERNFQYVFRTYYHKTCPECRASEKRQSNTLWARSRRGAVASGTILQANCKNCGQGFTYTLYRARRSLCDDCYSGDNLPTMERLYNFHETLWCRKKWKATLDAFGHKCVYCGVRPRRYHRDHFIPKSLGGPSDIGNILPSCPTCNLRKHNKHPRSYLKPHQYQYLVSSLRQLKADWTTGLTS